MKGKKSTDQRSSQKAHGNSGEVAEIYSSDGRICPPDNYLKSGIYGNSKKKAIVERQHLEVPFVVCHKPRRRPSKRGRRCSTQTRPKWNFFLAWTQSDVFQKTTTAAKHTARPPIEGFRSKSALVSEHVRNCKDSGISRNNATQSLK